MWGRWDLGTLDARMSELGDGQGLKDVININVEHLTFALNL